MTTKGRMNDGHDCTKSDGYIVAMTGWVCR